MRCCDAGVRLLLERILGTRSGAAAPPETIRSPLTLSGVLSSSHITHTYDFTFARHSERRANPII